MKPNTSVTVLLAAVACMIIVGCSSNSSDVATLTPASSDEQYFNDVVTGNDPSTRDVAVSDAAAYSDNAMYSTAQMPAPDGSQSIADDHRMHPLKWGRYLIGQHRVITKIELQGDSVAIVRVQTTLTGNYVVIGTVNGVVDTVNKPFVETLHRLFRFVRIGHGREGRGNWRLDAVAIINGGTGGTTIAISSMSVLLPTGDTLTANDPDAYFMQLKPTWLHGLPLFGLDVQITVTATVHSSDADTDVVTLYHAPGNAGPHRVAMTLIAQTADTSGGHIRVYSATLPVPGRDNAVSHLLVSATTHASLYSAASTDFSSVVWGLPYKTGK